jgi:hypothetical protein
MAVAAAAIPAFKAQVVAGATVGEMTGRMIKE